MRKINAALFITLDGVVEAPGGETTLPENVRGWSMPFTSDEVGQVIGAARAVHTRLSVPQSVTQLAGRQAPCCDSQRASARRGSKVR